MGRYPTLLCAHRFGADCQESNLLDERFGPINTSWAVLLYLLSVIGYLVFLVCPDPFLSQENAFAIQVDSSLAC